jgi:hypothetical protein
MNRRSALGFLGIGAAAGPQIVSQISEQLSGPPLKTDNYIGKQYLANDVVPYTKHADHIKEMQNQLSIITNEPEKWLAEHLAQELKDWRMGYASISYANIDPDIRNMKSITESSKMRIYFERKVRRQLENNKDHLMRNIAAYMGLV